MSSTSSSAPTPMYYGSDKEAQQQRIERIVTPGGHPADYSQPAIPHQHRKVGNPVPLTIISLAVPLWLIGFYSVHARGIHNPSVVVPTLMLYSGVAHMIAAWFEMSIGNTYSATIFGSFAGFIWGYASLTLPAFGIQASFTLPDGTMSPEFNQAVGLYFLVWAMVCFCFVVGSLRASLAILSTLFFVMLTFICLGIANLTGSDNAGIAGGAMAFCGGICGMWVAMAGFWTPDSTLDFIRVSPIDLSRKNQ